VNIKELAQYLGHGDPGFTLRLYTHMLPSSHERARKAVDSRLSRLFSMETHGAVTEWPPAGPPRPTGNLTAASLSMTLESTCDLWKHLPDAHAGDCAGDHQTLDFGGTFEDCVDLFQPAWVWAPSD
jgi:hypothetical protein